MSSRNHIPSPAARLSRVMPTPIILLFLLFLAALLTMLATPALFPVEGVRGETAIYVDDDAGEGGNGTLENPYSRIQDAVNASRPGDRVRVLAGNYTDNIIVNRSITLEGESRGSVTVEGAGGLDVVLVHGTSGVTIRNLSLSKSHPENGSALAISLSDHVRVSGLSVSECYIGILVLQSNDSLLSDIESIDNDVGMILANSVNITLQEGSLHLNKHYGLLMDNVMDCTVVDGQARGNSASGIKLEHAGRCRLENVTAESNHNNGIYVVDSDHITLEDSTARSNHYGMYILRSTNSVVERGIIRQNYHGIALREADFTRISDLEITDNDVVGLYVYLTDHTNATGNEIALNDIGIKDHFSENTLWENNTFDSNKYAHYYPETNLPPVAHIKVDNTSVDRKQYVFFDASASGDPNKDILNSPQAIWYKMDFGDGNITGWVDEPYFNHSYRSYGSYRVRLYVKDALGLESDEADMIVINVEKEKSMSLFLATSLFAVGILLVATIYLGIRVHQLKKLEINEAFLIYSDNGTLMCHTKAPLPGGVRVPGSEGRMAADGMGPDADGTDAGVTAEPEVDADLTVAMLTAIQDFIGDTFGKGADTSAAAIGKLEYGDSTIFVEKGEYVNLAVVASRPDNLIKPYMKKAIRDVETKFGDKLADWNGDVSEMEKAEVCLEVLFSRKSMSVLLKYMFSANRRNGNDGSAS